MTIDAKILWEQLKTQRNRNKKFEPEVSTHVNMGINQAIGIMCSIATGKTCEHCKYYDLIFHDCNNKSSPIRKEMHEYDDTCGAWEGKSEK